MVSNSTDPKAYSAGRILLVDPNPDNNQLVSPEELNIYVRLRTVTKERSSILANATGVTGIQNVGTTQLITFMNGSDLGGQRNLTTHYTELGTQFNKDNKDLETLGITGIKIEFNSSYTPMITINFEDVRGQLFTMGNESPYNVFFNLPYPLFELTVKGYYGKSVTYCLHLTKFNGKFNDATGNFEITCDFIGYTYAFLTDMLMGYLRAVTYTEAGKAVAEQKRSEAGGEDFLLFDELIDGVLNLEKDLAKMKKDDEKVKALAKSEDLLSLLSVVEDNLYRKLLEIGGENRLNSEATVAQGILIIEASKYDAKILQELETQFNLLVDSELDNINGPNSEHKDVTFDRKSLKIESNITKFDRGIKKKNFIGENYNENLIPNIDKEIYEDVSAVIANLSVYEEQELTLYYITNGFKALKTLEDDIRKRNVATKEEVAAELTDAIANAIAEGSGTGVKFEPTIYNFFKILSDHVDIFMDTIRSVSEEAKKDRARQLSGINDTRNLDTVKGEVQKLDNVLPWPEYKEKDEKVGAYVDKWIGNVAPSMPEVKFVEQLLDGLLKSRARDNDVLSQLDNGVRGDAWYPVNPLDTPLFTDGQNPWASMADTATQYDVIRLMLLRQTVFFNSHRDITDSEIKAMAKLEARNAYANIKNKDVKNSIKLFGGKADPNSISSDVLDKATKGFSGWKNNGSDINNNKIIKKTTQVVDPAFFSWFSDDTKEDFYEYIYTPQKSSLFGPNTTAPDYQNYGNKTKTYSLNTALPIYNANNNYNDYNGNFLIDGTYSERIAARENGYIFFSNYIGANSFSKLDRVDDGSTFIRILTPEQYSSMENSTFPEYGQQILTDAGVQPDAKVTITVEDYNWLQYWVDENPAEYIPLFGGIRKTPEFVNIVRKFEDEEDEDNASYLAGQAEFPAWISFYGDNNFCMVTPPRETDVKKNNRKRYTPFDVRDELYDESTGNFKNGVAVGYNGHVSNYIEDWKNWNDAGFKESGLLKTSKNVIIPMQFKEDDGLYEKNLSIQTRRVAAGVVKGVEDTSTSYSAFRDNQINLTRNSATVPYIDYKIHVTYGDKGSSHPSYYGVEHPVGHWTVSLFGSDFYYSQENEEAKAFLFLHTIPFEGLNNMNTRLTTGLCTDPEYNCKKFGLFRTVHSYFDQKAGFIEAPYSWILFLGGLLKRQKGEFINYVHDQGNIRYSYVMAQKKNGKFPSPNEYLLPAVMVPNGLMFADPCNNDEYINIGERIKRLPDQVKNEFIKQFDEWVNDGWKTLKEKLEIFDEGVTRQDRLEYWRDWVDKFKNNPYNVYKPASDGGVLRDGVFNDYVIIQQDFGFVNQANKSRALNCGTSFEEFGSKLRNASSVGQLQQYANDYDKGSPFNFFLEIRDGSDAARSVIDFLRTRRVIANATWRIWASDWEDAYDVVDGILDSRVPLSRFPFRVNLSKFNNYNLAFFDEWTKLVDEDVKINEEEQAKQELFNSLNNDDIKLNIYKNIKSIYDKWIAGTDGNFGCSAVDNLIKHFRFIDRTYRDIKDEFKVNPSVMVENIIRDYNQSFYEYIARVLVDNNFDFIPLPNFVDFSSEDEMVSVFKRFTVANANQANMQGPQFVCMYIGERSSKLNLGNTSQYDNDGFDIKIVDNNGTVAIDTSEFNDGAEDFLDTTTEGKVPTFLVRYGKQNQSVFTNFRLDQSEFSETDEGLRIIDDMSLKGGPNQATGLGQNLFDNYNTRAYSTEIQMLGNVQIQPLMYFQLYNVPMFHGAYTILKVSHDIRPNHMTTTFKGHRIRKVKTKLVDDSTLFMNLIGSLSDVNFEGASINNLSSGGYSSAGAPPWAGCISYQLQDNKGLKVQGGQNSITSGRIKNYMVKEIGDFMELIGILWYDEAKSKGIAGNTIYYNDASKLFGGDLPPHKSHKSGTDIDFRMLRKDNKDASVSYTDKAYDRDATIKLLEFIFDTALKQTKIKSNTSQIVNVVYFNDPQVISHFSNYKGYNRAMVKNSPGHDDHIHLRFNLPDRISNAESTGYQECVENLPANMNSSKCKTTYNELPILPRTPQDTLSYTDTVKYLNSKYPEPVAKAVFAIMGAEAKKNKAGNAFMSAGGHNYSGTQTDAGKWGGGVDKLFVGQFCKVDVSGRNRMFAAFEKPEDFLDFMASRVKAKGFDKQAGGAHWTERYLNSWVQLDMKGNDPQKYNKWYPNKLAIYNTYARKFDQLS